MLKIFKTRLCQIHSPSYLGFLSSRGPPLAPQVIIAAQALAAVLAPAIERVRGGLFSPTCHWLHLPAIYGKSSTKNVPIPIGPRGRGHPRSANGGRWRRLAWAGAAGCSPHCPHCSGGSTRCSKCEFHRVKRPQLRNLAQRLDWKFRLQA
jgi:hypothetical protein